MYERAVLRRTTGNVYDADVDLWSLGTTFSKIQILSAWSIKCTQYTLTVFVLYIR